MSSTDRDRSIRHAVLSSFVSKGGTAMLQFLALPIAMRVLGWEAFGLYASVAALLLTVQLFEIGIGPALTHGLSQAVASGDSERERRLYATSFYLLGAQMLAAGLLLGGAIALVPVERLFGSGFARFDSEMRPALWTGLGLFMGSFLFSHTDRAREGYLEARINNGWGAAGNLLAAAMVAGGVWFLPSVSYLLFAVYGSQLLAKLGNTLHLWRKRPWLLPSPRLVEWRLVRGFISDGLAYAVFASVVNFVEFIVCQNLFGRLAGPAGVTGYSVLVTITSALLGFVLMFTTPMWPAVVDAKSRGDTPWIRRTSRKLWLYVVVFALCAGAGLIAFGPVVLPLWVGEKARELDRPVLGAYAAYFLAFAWRHANHMLLVGTGRVRTLAVIQVVESLLVLGAAWIGMNHGGLAGLLMGMTAAIVAVTGWMLPMIFQREILSGERRESAASLLAVV